MSGPKFTRRQTIAMGSAAAAASLVPGAVRALALEPGQVTRPEQPLYDPITGLPGEQVFMDRIRELDAMNVPGYLGTTVAVFDIQNFHRFRTQHDDIYANSVAVIIARRLRRHLFFMHDIVARLRDDQFGLLYTTNDQEYISRDLASIQHTLRIPFRLKDQENVLTTHIGVMRKYAHVHLAPDLVAMARQAAVNARRAGREGPHYYDAGIVG